jgi:hypothetical protein
MHSVVNLQRRMLKSILCRIVIGLWVVYSSLCLIVLYYYIKPNNIIQRPITILSLEDAHNKGIQYLNTTVQAPCKVHYYQNAYYDKHEKNDSFTGSCHTSHTQWNKEKQEFSIKCALDSQIPMYRLSQFEWRYGIQKQQWRVFQSEAFCNHYWKNSSNCDTFVSSKDMDIIHTACVDLNKKHSIHNFHVQVIRDEAKVNLLKQKIQKDQKQPPVNIRVIILDSVSRESYDMNMPHTKEYIEHLKSNNQNSGFSVLDMQKYHIIGYNTIPNMLGFATGYQVMNDSMKELRAVMQYRTHYPTIWEQLRDVGYISSVGEDVGLYSEIQDLYHLQNSIDVYPTFHKVSYIVNRLLKNGRFSYSRYICPCTGQSMMAQIVFEHAQSMSQAYSDIPSFIMTASHEGHDNNGNQLLGLDKHLKDHLQWYVDTKRTDNTVVVLMSDHGMHYGAHYTYDKERAIKGHENPFMIMLVPDHMNTSILKNNIDKLKNVKDLYMTLKDFATYPERSSVPREDALSLLHDNIPEDRTCRQMLVPPAHARTCDK